MSREDIEAAERACSAHENRPDRLIEILHEVQADRHCVSDEAARHIAEALNISRAEIHGVRSFYTDFSDAPQHPARIRLCRAEACQSVGSEALAAELTARGVETDAVYCLGNCALGPAALIGTQLVGRATADRLAALTETEDA